MSENQTDQKPEVKTDQKPEVKTDQKPEVKILHPLEWQRKKGTAWFLYSIATMLANVSPEDETTAWTETQYDDAIKAAEAEIATARGSKAEINFVALEHGTLPLAAYCRRMTRQESMALMRDAALLNNDEDGKGEEAIVSDLLRLMVWPIESDIPRRNLLLEIYPYTMTSFAKQFLQRHGLDTAGDAAKKKR
jgi:hypothetical protein